MARGTRVLVAPDKFKGTLTGAEAAKAIAEGVLAALPGAEVRTAVMADGGEGTVDAAVAAGATPMRSRVAGPLGGPVEAGWALAGSRAVVELSAASGLQLLAGPPTPATALAASTAGTGELVLAALDAGATEILLGVGGAASTDGGLGALRALGAAILDAAGEPVAPGGDGLAAVAHIDLSGLDSRLAATPLTLVSDVAVPLLGPSGAARSFAPQKGADPATVELLEAGLAHAARVLGDATGRSPADLAGAGAAGGTTGGLAAALGATVASGARVVGDLVGLPALVDWADIVVTGEGSFDAQSLEGKAPVHVARLASGAGVPLVVVAGRIALDDDELRGAGAAAWGSALDEAGSPEAALGPDAAAWVSAAALAAIARLPA